MNAPKIQLCFDFEATSDGMDKAVALLKFADTLTPAQSPPPKQGKVTPAPAPAPKGKPAAAAAKANSKKPAPAPEPDDILDLGGDNEDEDDDQTGGLGLADDDAPEEPEFDGTPEEAKEEALAKLRVMLVSNKDRVKEVQKIMKVAKFHDVPAEQGFEFLAAVKAVEAKIGKN